MSAADSTQKKIDWKIIAAGAAAVIGVTSLVIAYTRKSKKGSKKDQVKKEQSPVKSVSETPKTESSSLQAAPQASVQAVATKQDDGELGFDDETLKAAILSANAVLETAGGVESEACVSLLEMLRKVAQHPSLSQFQEETRLKASEWLTAYYHIRSFDSSDPDSFFSSPSVQQDMNLAWTIGDLSLSPNSNQKNVARVLIDIASILKSPSKLSQAYSSLMLTPLSSLSSVELTQAFTSAPILGKWKDFIQLGQRVQEGESAPSGQLDEESPISMNVFHLTSVHGTVPDYYALFNYISENHSSLPDSLPSSLSYCTYEVLAMKKELRELAKVSIPAEQEKALREALMEEENKFFKTFHVFSPIIHKIQRQGSMILSKSFSPYPVPIQGRMEEGKMELQGFMTLPDDMMDPTQPRDSSLNSLTLQEEISLSLSHVEEGERERDEQLKDVDNNNVQLWKGTYAVKQFAAGTESVTLHMIFNLTYKLRKVD